MENARTTAHTHAQTCANPRATAITRRGARATAHEAKLLIQNRVRLRSQASLQALPTTTEDRHHPNAKEFLKQSTIPSSDHDHEAALESATATAIAGGASEAAGSARELAPAPPPAPAPALREARGDPATNVLGLGEPPAGSDCPEITPSTHKERKR